MNIPPIIKEPDGVETDEEEVGSVARAGGSRVASRINEEGGGDGFDADALSDDVSDTAWDTDLEIEGETFIDQCVCVLYDSAGFSLVSHYFSQLI